jgi:hypothetical protein
MLPAVANIARDPILLLIAIVIGSTANATHFIAGTVVLWGGFASY